MMSSTIPNKRTRLSEMEQSQHHQQQNLQQNLQPQQFTNQQSQLRQMFPNQVISGEFIQSPQAQQQQSKESDHLLTEQDVIRIEKGLSLLIEAIIPNKSQQAKEAATNIINSLSSIKNSSDITTQKN